MANETWPSVEAPDEQKGPRSYSDTSLRQAVSRSDARMPNPIPMSTAAGIASMRKARTRRIQGVKACLGSTRGVTATGGIATMLHSSRYRQTPQYDDTGPRRHAAGRRGSCCQELVGRQTVDMILSASVC